MQQSFSIVDTLFHRNHSFRSTHSFNIIYLINNIFRMSRISSAYFTENIEFSSSYVSYGYKWDVAYTLHHKLSLGGFEYINSDVCDKGIAQFLIIYQKGRACYNT